MPSLQILFEDDDLLLINKSAGRLTEGDPGSLEFEIQQIYDDRVRALHRLDLGTSGVLAFSLRRQHHAALVELWEKRRIKKTYWAWVQGSWPKNLRKLGGVDLDGRAMHSEAKILQELATMTCLELKPSTGRRHQLRIQCSSAGHPIVGDLRYGAQEGSCFEPNFALHARSLGFRHPLSGEQLLIEAEPPAIWIQLAQ